MKVLFLMALLVTGAAPAFGAAVAVPVTGTGGSGSVTNAAGSNQQLQYNSSGSFAASSKLFWNEALARLYVEGELYFPSNNAGGLVATGHGLGLTASNRTVYLSQPQAGIGDFSPLGPVGPVTLGYAYPWTEVRATNVMVKAATASRPAYINAQGYLTNAPLVSDQLTNTFTGTSFPLGTNAFISTATNIYVTSLLNVPTETSRVGQLTIVATADISITNAGAMRASDQVTSRLIPAGSTCKLRMEVQTGSYTNLDVVIY